MPNGEEQVLHGLEAQAAFLTCRDTPEAFALVRGALCLSYELHLGPDARQLLDAALTEISRATTAPGLDAAFARSRARFASIDFAARRARYRPGSLRRTLAIARLDRAAGHVVDLGAGDNALGMAFVNGQVVVPAGGQVKVPTPRLIIDVSWRCLLASRGLRACGRTRRR